MFVLLPVQAEEEAGVRYERKWDAVWVRAQDVINEGILISPRMTSDHYTTTLIGALQARGAPLGSVGPLPLRPA